MAKQIPSPKKNRPESKLAAFMRKWSIAQRLTTTALLSVFSFVFIFAVLINNARGIYLSFNKLIYDTTEEIQSLANINVGIQTLFSETREFALFQETGTLDEIEEALLFINENLGELREAGTEIEEDEEEEEEGAKLDKLELQIQELTKAVGEAIVMIDSGSDEEVIEEATEELEEIEENIVLLIEEISAYLEAEAEAVIAQMTQRVIRTISILSVGTIFLMVANLGLNHFSADSIVRPIQELVNISLQIADGDLMIEADDSGKDEISKLANAYNRMNARQIELIQSEENISQRLQENLAQLQASIRVTQVVSSILDSSEITERVVNLIQDAFGLYYVGFFTPDERAEWAILRTGTGEAGQRMLERNHQIKIGEGMIGWCIANAESRVAQVAGEDDLRLATEELPETRAEAAIPLRSRGRVVGALTVQDRRSNIFDEQTIAILQNMSDQVAIALENARLYAESQEALEASRRAFADITRDAWREYLGAQDDINYLVTPQVETRMQASEWASEMAETYSIGEITQHGENTLHIPIVLRDQTLGVVRLCKQEEAGAWSNEEIELMDTLVDQLETALETARLYSDTQNQAERERLTHEVTDKLHRSHDMDTLMQTLLQEVSNALGASSAYVQLSSDLTAPESASSKPNPTN